MKFDIITIFPHIFDCYLGESILGRAQNKKLITLATHDLRKWTSDRHKTVDGKPYGGGAGMVFMAEPILKAVDSIKKKKKSKVGVFSAKGKPFDQKMAYEWTRKYDHLVFVTGRYEGIDERVVAALKAEEISIGPYVLTDGDVAAMVVISSVARLIPGVIRLESLQEESHWNLLVKGEPAGKGLEYPHYTRPEVLTFKGKRYRVPNILLSGNHKKIAEWRAKKSKR